MNTLGLLAALLLLVRALGTCPVKPCCSMTPAELTACEDQHAKCPSGVRQGLIGRDTCAECPRGLCRALANVKQDGCFCPATFRRSRLRARCRETHGRPWPASAAFPHLSRRRCAGAKHLPSGKVAGRVPRVPRAVLAACPVKPCCEMTRDELEACRGLYARCPSWSARGSRNPRQCRECPRGLCRAPHPSRNRDYCLCPRKFVRSVGWQKRCVISHGKAWPLSTPSPELDRRRCAGTTYAATGLPAGAIPRLPAEVLARCPVKNCCAMSREELTACRGVSDGCPSKKVVHRVKRKTCAECGQGTCRLPTSGTMDACVCPETFLGSRKWQTFCSTATATGESWPRSVGKEAIGRPRCIGAKYKATGEVDGALPPIAPDLAERCPVKDCCAMTEAELVACRGVHVKCPSTGEFFSILRASCKECPRGMCRLPGSGSGAADVCFCPDKFHRSRALNTTTKYQGYCKQSHGAAWPYSAGKTQIDRKHCAKNVKQVEESRAGESEAGKTALSGTPRSTNGEQGTKANNANAGDKGGNRRFSSGELAGIITGTVSAIAAVAAVIVAYVRREVFVAKGSYVPRFPPRAYAEDG